MNRSTQWVHIIGICGVTTGPLANMFKKMDFYVTGSDKGIFPPMSDYLKSRKIPIELGFKEEHLEIDYYKKKYKKVPKVSEHPDIIVVGNYISLKNVEYLFAKSNDLRIYSYPDVLSEYLIKSNSVVIAGTSGKTTSTALLALIFEKAGLDPSFMIGGIAKNFKDGIKNTKSDWSIVEGDEYSSARFDMKSKFFHYRPEFLLLTMCAWEHTDIFKTDIDYVNNFKKMLSTIPENGIIVANKNGENVLDVLQTARCKVVTYELNEIDNKYAQADWFNLAHKENPKTGEIVMFNKHTKEEFIVNTKLIGKHNRENIIGCCALARELNIEVEAIQKAVEAFEGIERRLEIRYKDENTVVIDDHACSPPKVIGSLNALRNEYPAHFITVIFEPNVGNRTEESLPLFDNIFEKADEVIIPHLKPLKAQEGEKRIMGKELATYLRDKNVNALFIEDDKKLVEYVTGDEAQKHLICFMGAYGWRKMIEDVIEIQKSKFKNQN